jgi:hypothetical protein
MLPYFLNGLMVYGGADAPDGWSYIAVGQALWEYKRGTEGQLASLYQYAGHLYHIRFMSSALLAFLSPLTLHPGDTQTTANLFYAWLIFTFTSACALFANSLRLKKFTPIYLFIVIYSIWTLKLLALNNFDNAILLCLLPTMVGLISTEELNQKQLVFLLSLIVSASWIAYPELSPLVMIGLFVLLGFQSLKQKNFIAFPKMILAIFLIALVFTLPYLKEGFLFFKGQLTNAYAIDGRAGEGYFSELTSCRHRLSVILGGEPNTFIFKLLGLSFLILLIQGWVILWKKAQKGLVLFNAFVLCFAAYEVFIKHYSYGAYKLFLVNWWLLCFCMIIAVSSLLNIKRLRIFFIFVFASLSYFYLNGVFATQTYFANQVSILNINPYRELYSLPKITQNHGILVDVNDGVKNEWAVYYLRNSFIKIKEYKIYMNNARMYMDRAKVPNPKQIKFVLTDHLSQNNPEILWTSGPYYLLKSK